MSWMNRGQAGAGPGPQPYASPQPQAQPFGNQQNAYPNYPGATGTGTGCPPPQPAQQYWQTPAQQYRPSGQYAPDYPPNANHHYHQPAPAPAPAPAPSPAQYNHNYANPQQNYQNYYQNQTVPQNYIQNMTPAADADGWEDNWDWGWEEAAKKTQRGQSGERQPQPPAQQQPFNNANVIEESFAGTDGWNWTTDDKRDNGAPAAPSRRHDRDPPVQPAEPTQNVVPPVHDDIDNRQAAEEVKTLNDREVIEERLPNLALGKRFHLENLTPQWSIESQMSQESSDGPHTHSEGTYRSENLSRNSSSPGPNTDSSNYNYARPLSDETYTHNGERSKNPDPMSAAGGDGGVGAGRDELSDSLRDMSITHDHRSSANYVQAYSIAESRSVQDNALSPSAPSPASFPTPVSGSVSALSTTMPPPPPASSAQAQPPLPFPRPPSPSSACSLPGLAAAPQPDQGRPAPALATSSPPSPPPSNSQNPFQRAGPFSHKSTGQTVSSSVPQQPHHASSARLISPTLVNEPAQRSRAPVDFEANLETTPDNSERPDRPQAAPPAFRARPHPLPDNMEVAPQRDRNEYLQTAHLSGPEYPEGADSSPPAGLRRLVVGHREADYRLARTVPGQRAHPADDYRDRRIDGRPTAEPFLRPRPPAFDRMVPGEPSDADYAQYEPSGYAVPTERRVVTGLERGSSPPPPPPLAAAEVRQQTLDGADYSEPAPRTPHADAPVDSQRELTVEGENLQDLSVASAEQMNSRERPDPEPAATDAVADAGAERRRSHDRVRTASSGEDSERNRTFRASPRRHRRDASRERDRNRDKEGRHSRGSPPRKYERERERERDKDGRREEGAGGSDARKHRRGARSRKYDTEDTDYYSDRERDRRGYREGSYASKPPRPGDRDRDRRHERDRQYHTIERDRPRDSQRRGERDRDRDRERDRVRDRDRYVYRDIDPSRKYGNLRREREEEERRRVTFSTDTKSNDSRSEGEPFPSASRPESREATDEDGAGGVGGAGGEARRSQGRARRTRHHRPDTYYDGYGAGVGVGVGADPYLLQRQQYEYYEQLRLTDPAAYLRLYNQLMQGHAQHRALDVSGYGSVGYETRAEERGSVHSGRSSTNGLKGNDTFYVSRQAAGGAASLYADLSDRELNTDASLNLQLDSSTVRSERMTPFRYSTAHVKCSLGGGGGSAVVVPAAYPVDGRAATVRLVSLASARHRDPAALELRHAPGPLVKGVTHKKSVIEYCMVRVRGAGAEGARDVTGYALLWELLALMLKQNGVVVGTDIAELLMKNTREHEHEHEHEHRPAAHNPARVAIDSRAGSSPSGSAHEESGNASPPPPSAAHDRSLAEPAGDESTGSPCVYEKAALDKFREYLLYGNLQEALEWAMSNELWGHALQLAAGGDRRARAAVSARFLAAIPGTDPLHTLYATRANAQPPVLTGVSEARWGEWRTHAAMLLANASPAPDHHARALTTLGDSLLSRGLIYCAQFCYVCGGVPFAQHPLAPLKPAPAPPDGPPPRLSLLLADPKASSLRQFATTRAILATEIYEYARSLNADYVIAELQVYKLVMACRLVDAGRPAAALAYAETCARAVTRHPAAYAPRLVRALADLADRLKYHDPAMSVQGVEGAEGGADSAEGSPRHHQWLDDVMNLAHTMQTGSAHSTPQHQHDAGAPHTHADYSWGDQAQQYQQSPNQTYVEPEETTDYSQYYRPDAAPPAQPAAVADYAARPADEPPPTQYHYEQWNSTEESHADPYWQGAPTYAYGEGAAEGESSPRPTITMPGAAPTAADHYSGYDDDRPPSTERPERESDGVRAGGKSAEGKSEGQKDGKGRSWIGGILTKLSLRPPNQMILPDDKNPTIVWDPAKKRWCNTDGEASEAERAPPPPPPRTADLAPHLLQPPQAASPPPQSGGAPASAPGDAAPPLAPVSNIFKMQKGRHIKKSYVDVFNPSGAATRPLPPAAEVLGPAFAPALAAPNDYFVPAHQGYEAVEDNQYRSGI